MDGWSVSWDAHFFTSLFSIVLIDLILAGGRPRGTLYAVYRFLGDEIGVRWWSPFEQHVPRRPTLKIAAMDRSGEPRFHYRDIHLVYASDGGRFAARNRLNGHGFGSHDATLGGERIEEERIPVVHRATKALQEHERNVARRAEGAIREAHPTGVEGLRRRGVRSTNCHVQHGCHRTLL